MITEETIHEYLKLRNELKYQAEKVFRIVLHDEKPTLETGIDATLNAIIKLMSIPRDYMFEVKDVEFENKYFIIKATDITFFDSACPEMFKKSFYFPNYLLWSTEEEIRNYKGTGNWSELL